MTPVSGALAVGALGLLVGSFLNVCIHRLPRRESVVWGGSRCPRCGRAIRWYENVPVLSYLRLGGRCAGCRERISLVYPLVELANGLAWGVAYWIFGPTPLLVSRLVFVSAMIALAVTDLQHRILPNPITYGGTLAGLIFSLVAPPGFRDATLAALGASALLFLTGEIVSRLLGKEALGMGDVKMVAMMGAFLGWKLTLVAVFCASILGSVVGLGLVAVTRNRGYEIPLGTFLAIGAVAAAGAGEAIIAWYTGSVLGF